MFLTVCRVVPIVIGTPRNDYRLSLELLLKLIRLNIYSFVLFEFWKS